MSIHFTTSLGTTTNTGLVTFNGKISDATYIKGAPKKETIDDDATPAYKPQGQTEEISEKTVTPVSILQGQTKEIFVETPSPINVPSEEAKRNT
ncbi:hypothetical protein CEXT_731471 [Caerostris extrusa]|uniref:Uncharacterized protein n=1 Tax=Caerostris extrusa TaxID=172846 RepID=A0AAV4SRB4_CAEEX|nr:hypothetical protein CEXT_731471 [Caerostris extrusa]